MSSAHTPRAGSRSGTASPQPAGEFEARPQRSRRRPQRWEGAPRTSSRRTVPARAGVLVQLAQRRAAEKPAPALPPPLPSPPQPPPPPVVVEEDAETASVHSTESVSPPPERACPLDSMSGAMAELRAKHPQGGKALVNAFHAWQLRAVSAESSHQKALHAYLKRRLRKRAVKSAEHERVEEDALRNACSAAPTDDPIGEARGDDAGMEDTDEDDETRAVKRQRKIDAAIVPDEIRLSLEAYLPRRVSQADKCITIDELRRIMPKEPEYPEWALKLVPPGSVYKGQTQDDVPPEGNGDISD
jgi:hypothetical protein